MKSNVIDKYYSDSREWYHTRYHIEDLYFLYNVYRDHFIQEFPNLDEEKLFVIFDYHDAIYVPGSKTNEEDSVQVYLENGGRDKDVIDGILSTKIGTEHFDSDLEKIMHDLDWSGFRDYNSMLKNEEKIICEAMEKGGYSEQEAIEGQIRFYEMIKDKDIFVTKTFSKFNEITKKNIARRLNGR